ncbi:MAG: hydantoinase/oxoprolinase family protein [Alphaproteobacteria bacterium]|nr:hydantoinase/oxoprolinase family protein [Alphaproteobacteria bacterium]
MSLFLSIDTGGTHTDVVLVDDDEERLLTLKVPTTPDDLRRGVADGIERILGAHDKTLPDVARLVYGTTLVTNLILQHGDVPVGLITTENFRDILEIGRAYRYENIYDLEWRAPKALVPRHRRIGVPERIDARGDVVAPLDEAKTREILGRLVADGVESVAICLLNAYVNPEHEQRIAAIAREAFPHLKLSLSSEIVREFREFERTSTTVVNAFVMKPLDDHLGDLETTLRDGGLGSSPYIMRANGGIMTFGAAREVPIALTHSGPMGGIVGAATIAAHCGLSDLITLDMGGTSTDVSLISNGKPVVTTKAQISGHPVKLPMLDLVTIGAGGGSIAWIDPGGRLKVGPQSAGANPGPACYGLGGENPTITDANLLVGHLNPDFFLGGARQLDASLAEAATARIAAQVGLSVVDTAFGIIRIGESHMVNAIKLASIKRGLDPRDMTLVAFGGAGPLHAVNLAAELDMQRVVIPCAPGNLSALGMLDADIRHDFVLSRIVDLQQLGTDELRDGLQGLVRRGAAWLAKEGMDGKEHCLLTTVDLRYAGQNYELNLPFSLDSDENAGLDALAQAFHAEHERVYGYAVPDDTVQLVNLRVSAIGALPAMRWRGAAATQTPPVPVAERTVRVDRDTRVTAPVFRFDDLFFGDRMAGPAIVEFTGSTLVVPSDWEAQADAHGNLHVTRQGASS